MGHAAVFLDRDGVINRSAVRGGKPYAPRRLTDFRLLPGVARAVAELRAAGFMIVVATNQPDIGNGLVDIATVEAMHVRLKDKILVDAIMVCPHRQDAGCSCRKPRAGLLRAAARRLKIDPSRSFMVGDRWHDILAGRRFGCYTIRLDRDYKESRQIDADATVRSLPAAARYILALTKGD
jgi:D-glycero-D-manno-heptose 1,7-bisphosphate phosphatase